VFINRQEYSAHSNKKKFNGVKWADRESYSIAPLKPIYKNIVKPTRNVIIIWVWKNDSNKVN
jgi:hypothetical protein